VRDAFGAGCALFAAGQSNQTHVSRLAGLIYATRRATAVVGWTAARCIWRRRSESKASRFTVRPIRRGTALRRHHRGAAQPDAVTTYRRTSEPDASMREITPDQVFEALVPILAAHKDRTRSE
jgi:hypothetical protein